MSEASRDPVAPLTVKGVCLDAGGRVLVCRNWRREWELPGGPPALGEELTACLVREIREETGLEVQVHELLTAYPFEVVSGSWVDVVAYGCELRGPGRDPVSSGEHAMVAFRALSDVTNALPAGYRAAARMWQERRLQSRLP